MTESEDSVSNLIFVSIGTDEEFLEDNIFACILVGGIEIPFYNSDISVQDASADVFLRELGNALNLSRIISRELLLEIRIDDAILDCAEEIGDVCVKETNKLLKEVGNEN
jgi:hypothetical protein